MPPSEELAVSPRTRAEAQPLARTLAGAFAVQDLILVGYLAVLEVVLLGCQASAVRLRSMEGIGICIAVALAGVATARVLPRIPDRVRNVVYPLCLVGALMASYALLRDIIPIVREDAVDAALLEIDLALFRVEPALWLERLNRRPIIEWFAACYFGYYFVLAGFTLTVTVLLPKSKQTTVFAVGTFLVYCTGHLCYLIVPAQGPWSFLADRFTAPLDGGFFWHTVWNAYREGSPSKEVFPSLHTGAPTWFALYSFWRARRDRRWLVPAVVTAFVAANIVFSTQLLRWHYLIDIFAGVSLAAAAAWAAPRIVDWEEARRSRLGLPGVWPTPP